MKKHSLIIILFAAMTTLMSFSSGSNLYTNEPNDSIARIIWKQLTTNDPNISKVVTLTKGYVMVARSYAEEFYRKTNLDYAFDGDKKGDDSKSIYAIYHLQCYPMSDGGWLAVIDQNVEGSELAPEYCVKKIFVIKYNDGKITYLNNKDVFPENFSFVENNHYTNWWDSSIEFSDTDLKYNTSLCYPLTYVWNGKKFETKSEFIYNAISLVWGYISTPDGLSVHIGDRWNGSPDGIFKDKKGKPVAKLTLKNNIVEGYTVLDPSYGTVEETQEGDKIPHAPIALGCYIKNVLAYKNVLDRSTRMKDTVITQGMKNGKYVITQQLNHDIWFSKRDIFIDFEAKDDDSSIDAIRVYSTPIKTK